MAKLSSKKTLEKKPIVLQVEPIKKASFFATIKKNIAAFFSHPQQFARLTFLLALISIVAAGYFFVRFNELKKDPTREIDKQTQDLIAQVSKLVVLPKDEIPTIATVSDPEKLKDQPFFAQAKEGYKVLIYTNAKKAILFDPVENKIIEIAPINLGKPPA